MDVRADSYLWERGNVPYIPCVACVIYATPRYIARKRVQNGSVIHGAGGEFVHRISNSAKTVLNM